MYSQYTKVDEDNNVVKCSADEAHYLSVYRILPNGTSEWIADFDASETELVEKLINS